MFEWLFRRQRRRTLPFTGATAAPRETGTQSLAAPPPDDASLPPPMRIARLIERRALGDLVGLGDAGVAALSACLWSQDREVRQRAREVLEDKVTAAKATPGLAAALSDPRRALQDAVSIGVRDKNVIDVDPERLVVEETLSLLARRGDERGLAAVCRLCETPSEYTERAVHALEEMLKRKRVFAHLDAAALEALAAMPDVSGRRVGTDADRFDTSVLYPPHPISCENVRALAAREIQRRADH